MYSNILTFGGSQDDFMLVYSTADHSTSQKLLFVLSKAKVSILATCLKVRINNKAQNQARENKIGTWVKSYVLLVFLCPFKLKSLQIWNSTPTTLYYSVNSHFIRPVLFQILEVTLLIADYMNAFGHGGTPCGTLTRSIQSPDLLKCTTSDQQGLSRTDTLKYKSNFLDATL